MDYGVGRDLFFMPTTQLTAFWSGLFFFGRLFPNPVSLAPANPLCPGNLLGHWVVYGDELYSPAVGLHCIARVSPKIDYWVNATHTI